MNYKKLGKIFGKIMVLESLLMLAPLLVSFLYREDTAHKLAFFIPMCILCLLGFLLQLPKPHREVLYQKEGFALTGLVWIVMGLFGALPFVISGDVPNYVDACFEIISGFTTTGASIIENLSVISHSVLLWRSLSHWIGGMGILVFVLIFIPESKDGSSMHLLRAESPGPQVGKIASKMKVTTRILYLIYLCLTVLEVVLLMLDEPIPGYESEQFFFSLLTAFGSAGTGGFGFLPGSMELYSPFSQYVIAIFLLLFGINFSLYYLLLIGKLRSVFQSGELHFYLCMVAASVTAIFASLLWRMSSFPQTYTTEEAFRHSLFQVASIVTTTGYSTTDFNLWPMPALTTLMILMFIGGMAGSTAGGIKISRIIIALKGMLITLRRLINPRYVPKEKLEGKTLEEKTINGVFAFLSMYLFLLVGVMALLSLDPSNGQEILISSDAGVYTVKHGFFTNFSAALSCLSNIGPGFEAIGPYGSFSLFSPFSKILLTLTMIVGRLEILPVLILFSPKTWRRV